jgi:hypothetical protein
MRIRDSYLCAGHDADARNKRAFAGDAPKTKTPVTTRTRKKLNGLTFAMQCDLAGLPIPIPECTFHPTRKWRFDWAFIDARLAVEIEGGAFLKDGGRHTRGSGFRNDLEKYAEAAILGYRVIRVLPEWVASGRALTLVARALTSSNK